MTATASTDGFEFRHERTLELADDGSATLAYDAPERGVAGPAAMVDRDGTAADVAAHGRSGPGGTPIAGMTARPFAAGVNAPNAAAASQLLNAYNCASCS